MTRKTAVKYTLSVVTSLATALFFGYAACVFEGHYSAFQLQSRRLRIADSAVIKAGSQRRRVKRYNLTMAEFAKFSRQVEHYGLEPDRWRTYDVHLDKILPLSEAGNIIAQLAPGAGYYFQPLTLSVGTGNYIKTTPQPTTPADPTAAPASPPPDVQPAAPSTLSDKIQAGEVFLKVQGKFIVREKK